MKNAFENIACGMATILFNGDELTDQMLIYYQ